MHHFIYPSQDTYITNRPNVSQSNYGVDEILQVGTQNSLVSYISPTTDYAYSNTSFPHIGVTLFNGQFTGSVTGITGSSFAYLNGTLYTSSFEVNNFTGSIATGSLICLFGTASGIDTRNQRSRQYATQSYADRALLKFDLTAISNSISMSQIINPKFALKVKICSEFQLPIEYSIYAFPVTESWVMGNGYMSDGGSDEGASWVYRDFDGGTPWSASGATYGTPACSQSFRYKSADIDMDVTPIVNSWLSGAPNYGFVLISSDEFHPTGSGFLLKYFSEDTNTIYSPVLDVMWGNDWVFETGSVFTASATVTTVSGSNTTVSANTSTFYCNGGVHGNFSGSAFTTFNKHYITASEVSFTGSLVEQLTGSISGSFYGTANGQGYFTGSGGFSASFTGSIDGTGSIEITSSGVIGTNVEGYIIGDVSMPSFLGTYSGSLNGNVWVQGNASGIWLDEVSNYFVAFISASGFSGNIIGVPVYGPAEGLIDIASVPVVLPNEVKYRVATAPMESPYAAGPYPLTTNPYTYLNQEYYWNGHTWVSTTPITPNTPYSTSCGISHSVNLMTGQFLNGPFSQSYFNAYYANYQILFADLTGSWTSQSLAGTRVYIPLPQATYPYVTAYIQGPYVYGNALGLYQTSGSFSASFTGQIVSGPLAGGQCFFQLSGSAETASYSYTSSVQLTASCFDPLNTNQQFSVNITNLQPTYKGGDIVKINVFARPKFPWKDFSILTQQKAYLVPQYLPISSSWALKDNQTDEIVVNFDSYTQISCQYPEGNFFVVDTTSLPQERYYRILIRVEDQGQIDTIDTGKTFKITR